MLLDSADRALRARGCTLRIRTEAGRSLLTFKGPVTPGPMKLREEIETLAGDGDLLRRILAELGFHPWFRYQKYREEYGAEDAVIALDDTPIGTFVEIEGGEAAIDSLATVLGHGRQDYIVESYRGLFLSRRTRAGLIGSDMIFPDE